MDYVNVIHGRFTPEPFPALPEPLLLIHLTFPPDARIDALPH